ncbi:MAG: 30S ribosomal protein S4 [Candidatus Magasanikbacteria bacterium]|nr:30S ribosomal protein S4 [Candidatus Magasanikbacteria bacterium]
MARDLKPKHKFCRKYGLKLCDSPKCPVTKRSYAPGVHGNSKKHTKQSVYGKQLFEKQKAKQLYGLLEKQFSNYVAEASNKTGDTAKFLVNYLESRLDNVMYRTGLASSRRAGRQLVSHGHVLVNGKKVNIPSYRVRVGEEIALAEKSKGRPLFAKISEKLAKVEAPGWLGLDSKKVSAKVLNAPTVDDPGYDAKSIIEFYSR